MVVTGYTALLMWVHWYSLDPQPFCGGRRGAREEEGAKNDGGGRSVVSFLSSGNKNDSNYLY